MEKINDNMLTPKWIIQEIANKIERDIMAIAMIHWFTIEHEWRGAGECQ